MGPLRRMTLPVFALLCFITPSLYAQDILQDAKKEMQKYRINERYFGHLYEYFLQIKLQNSTPYNLNTHYLFDPNYSAQPFANSIFNSAFMMPSFFHIYNKNTGYFPIGKLQISFAEWCKQERNKLAEQYYWQVQYIQAMQYASVFKYTGYLPSSSYWYPSAGAYQNHNRKQRPFAPLMRSTFEDE